MPIHSQDIEQSQILKSIKGSNFVANLRKMMFYSPNADLFNAYVYTKFGYILSIHSQALEKKSNTDASQGQFLCCKFAKNEALQFQHTH